MAKVEAVQERGSGGVALTAAHVATALVAACRHVGIDPAAAFDADKRSGRARRIAAAGCIARLGLAKATAARVFKIEAIRLAPTKLKAAGIEVEDLLVVAEALEAGGLTVGDHGAARFRQPYAAPVETPVATRPAPVAKPPKPAPAPAPRPATPVAPAASRPALTTPGRTPVGRTLATSVARATTATRLKAVNDNMVRWTRQQVRLGVSVSLMADLFGVDADALAQAVAPRAEAA